MREVVGTIPIVRAAPDMQGAVRAAIGQMRKDEQIKVCNSRAQLICKACLRLEGVRVAGDKAQGSQIEQMSCESGQESSRAHNDCGNNAGCTVCPKERMERATGFSNIPVQGRSL